ncbi:MULTISPECIES: Slam-dependent surface lipoprotein [Rodentibacter]|uniref:Slam-dependent surface lipoprotein n=1 Tax=Rodentibacter TaxID=1960084 RepID=UPI001CFE55C3|nr:Slam-dependent surface lipoprotein [Rodentibacter sp. JRC1]GJI56254.1 hypothetical protein HEMROJRC1_13660 [Rodentibacter sp. JRC1]
MTLTKFVFTALAALMVSACGSSGGGSSDNKPQQNNASNNAQTNPPANNQSQKQAPNGAGDSNNNQPKQNNASNNAQTNPPANNQSQKQAPNGAGDSNNNQPKQNNASNNAQTNPPANNQSQKQAPNGAGDSNNNQPKQNNASNNAQTNPPANNQSQEQAPNGAGDSNNQPKQNNAPNNAQTNPPAENQSQQPVRSGTGAAIVTSGSDDNVNIRIATLNDSDLSGIDVDGFKIPIAFPHNHSGSWLEINDKITGYLEVCCYDYSDTRFGVKGSPDENNKGYMFYNGNPTKDMPASGTAAYSGQSIIAVYDVPALEDEDYYQGTSKFNVDFGNKTLKGSLDIQNIQPVNIDAKISGNSFTGTAKSDSIPSSGAVEGKFYGENAKEMAGLALGNDKSWGAAFGAQKK